MTPEKRKYRKEYAFELIKIARGDFESAQALAQAQQKGRLENVLYLCQQSIEKAIKGVICFREQAILHTHDLNVLLTSIPPELLPPESHRLGSLNQYANIRRYEEGYEEIDQTDLELTLELTQKILDWASLIANPKGSSSGS